MSIDIFFNIFDMDFHSTQYKCNVYNFRTNIEDKETKFKFKVQKMIFEIDKQTNKNICKLKYLNVTFFGILV